LVHILAAEWVWLSRWGGHSPTAMPEAWDASTVDTLREEWTKVEDDQKAFLSNLDERGLRETIAYRDTKGNPFRQPLWQMLRHVVNHSTYHRGQIVTMLRQLGAEAPATDMILFHRERSPRPRPEPTS
ncbi:MAG: damage-inducible protein DinB, partial [Gemmatimonadetes bacterium]|nr:damage-inducible protein DinB [Gemmatimonadota bacterium]NIU32053.1 damage-inducible protein DinB [Gemmatimonadota bacterium]NIV62424.1 damage-inducible protein DinB [Gemmatimonadota bacterium]NIW65157.1 damage-inducible protein DinB [Gemmatimonadota bacterium]NIX40502.1 damage-inducible protein DinB [Gemmatimonadota bacterium]